MDIALETEISDLVSYLASINELDASSLTDEIIELRENLVELIDLKKEELLECKKSILLQKFDLQVEEIGIEEEDDIVGSTRSINFRYHNGSSGRRNIVIYDSLHTDNGLCHTSFFLHPIYQSELPCQMFLNNVPCPYQQSCKFSHGALTASVDMDDAAALEPVVDGSSCLAQIEPDGVWRRCTVLHIDDAANSCVVQLDQSLRNEKVFSVDLDRVTRYRDSDEHRRKSESDCQLVDDCQTVARVDDVASTFGAWERHTRGIGMRLLLQMGYERDRGLGKHQQGRLEPVEVASVPQQQRKSASVATKRPTTKRAVASGGSATDQAKATLVRNDTKLRRLQSAVVALERSKERHGDSQLIRAAADKRISAMQHKMTELRAIDKRIGKQLDKQTGGKLKIF